MLFLLFLAGCVAMSGGLASYALWSFRSAIWKMAQRTRAPQGPSGAPARQAELAFEHCGQQTLP
jgi:hypothetical protein